MDSLFWPCATPEIENERADRVAVFRIVDIVLAFIKSGILAINKNDFESYRGIDWNS